MSPELHFKINLKHSISSYKLYKGCSIIRERCLKVGDTYFKKRRVIHRKFETFITVSSQLTTNSNHCDI